MIPSNILPTAQSRLDLERLGVDGDDVAVGDETDRASNLGGKGGSSAQVGAGMDLWDLGRRVYGVLHLELLSESAGCAWLFPASPGPHVQWPHRFQIKTLLKKEGRVCLACHLRLRSNVPVGCIVFTSTF